MARSGGPSLRRGRTSLVARWWPSLWTEMNLTLWCHSSIHFSIPSEKMIVRMSHGHVGTRYGFPVLGYYNCLIAFGRDYCHRIDMEHRRQKQAGVPLEDRQARPATWVNMC
ncbi:hypothetical protein ACQJBY_068015 [Aegilops geniculata]